MKLFEMKDWEVTVAEEAWQLIPFKKILDRDKTKTKKIAHAEMAYIWFFADIKSDYLTMPEDQRIVDLTNDISGLPTDWKPDQVILDAIEYYGKFETVIERLYKQTLKSAYDIGDYLENTKTLLAERDVRDKPVYDIAKITAAVDKVPKLMKNLKDTYKEVVKEREDNDNKAKGKRQFNTFEDGIQ